ncbi:MAG: OmpA family protein [Rhodobacterales bacterium]|nr:OmpA family protein [Rhodobacterales bacterium]
MADKGGGGGAPMWMVTFADLMALLLTLFVLLLTFAEMDVVKYKAVAGALSEAFGATRKEQLAGVIEIDGSLRRKTAADVNVTKPEEEIEQTARVDIPSPDEGDKESARPPDSQNYRASQLEDAMRQAIRQEMADSGVQVARKGNAVVIRFPSEIAFPSGSDVVTPEFIAAVDKLVPILQRTTGQVRVSGHTDNVPVAGGKYRSNWDLSAARATSVVHYLIDVHQLDPGRITVQGFGDSRPLVPNDTPEHRATNRRVEIEVVANPG